ncbi:hypothetical protein R6Q57_020558 [Mikania cordata]
MRMGVFLLSFLLLIQSSIILASGFLHLKACGTYHISYSSDSSSKSFYLNGDLVSKDLFCKSIKLYHANHCFINRNIRSLCYKEDHFSGGRRSLQNVVQDRSFEGEDKEPKKTEDDKDLKFNSKYLVMGGSGILVLCCALLCPCFRSRKKDMAHAVLAKEPSSMDSVSSIEMNSVSEKVPASPLRVPPSPRRFSMSPKLDRIGSVHLTMNQVARATQNFSPSLKLGEGGFGTVYKAQLPDGQFVAIKRAKREHFDALRSEFRSEVELLAKIDHRNLVKLLGYVDKGNERLIITEYVPNGTLREHLDGVHGSFLDFSQRLEICIDVAHGLTYLHLYAERQIIHRDVKSSNILLTERLRAKVADFGFARLGDVEADKTHVVTKVRGTVGYLDPEYMRTYQLTPKSDVYSFGVLLIEILTGRRPIESKRSPEEKVTVRWVSVSILHKAFHTLLN